MHFPFLFLSPLPSFPFTSCFFSAFSEAFLPLKTQNSPFSHLPFSNLCPAPSFPPPFLSSLLVSSGLPRAGEHARLQLGVRLRPLRRQRRFEGAAGPAAAPSCTPALHQVFQVRHSQKINITLFFIKLRNY